MAKAKTGQTKGQTKTKAAKRGGAPKKSRGAATTSDAADARWTVRGVPLNVREMAVNGAKERNMTVGDWLAELIVLNRKNHTADEKVNVPALPIPELVDMVQAMNDRLTSMEERQSQSVFSRLFGGQNSKAA